jgi:hypothetical protein
MNITDIFAKILLSIFTEWISVKSVCRLNSAFCNKKHRSFVISIVSVQQAAVEGHNSLLNNINPNHFVNLQLSSNVDIAHFPFSSSAYKILATKYAHYKSELFSLLQNYDKENRLEEMNCIDSETSVFQLQSKVLNQSSSQYRLWATDENTSILAIQHKRIVYRGRTRNVYVKGSVKNNEFTINHEDGEVLVRNVGFDLELHYIGQVSEDFEAHGYGVGTNKLRVGWVQPYLYALQVNGINDEYSGDWIDGRREGHGTQHYMNGDVYKGQWINDCRHGKGSMTGYLNESEYNGSWCEDRKSGGGEMKFKSGEVLVGKWDFNSLPTQKCSLMLNNGDLYKGTFNHGMLISGDGSVNFANGESFDGKFEVENEFCVGCFHSRLYRSKGEWFHKSTRKIGSLVKVNGDVLTGTWIRDAQFGEWMQINLKRKSREK